MHFIAASFHWSRSDHSEHAIAPMSAARHLARGHALEHLTTAGGALAIAGAEFAVATSDAVTAIVINPERAAGEHCARHAEALATSYAKRGAQAFSDLPQPWQGVVVDSERRTISAAIDRFAIAQLFYVHDDERLILSSDLDALIAHPGVDATIAPQSLYDYLFFHCIPAPKTIYRDVFKLEPAGVITWHDGRIDTAVSWAPRFAPAGEQPPPAGELLDHLGAAVAIRTGERTGAFLSGGLDSSTVAGLLTQRVAKAPSFTIGFGAEGYDESGFARVSAEHFGTTHHEYFVTPADIVAEWPAIAAFYGEPFGNSSVIPAYYCARFARQHGVEVMLAGDGGDELFGGNERYVTQNVFERYFDLPRLLRRGLESGYRLLPLLRRLPVAGKGYRYIEQARMGLPDRLQSYNFLNRFALESVFEPSWLATVDPQAPWSAWRARYAEAGDVDALHAMLFLDWKFTLADNDLVKVNYMCELADVAVSYPMLDAGLVDYATRVPAAALNPGGRLRGFYKDATREFLPRAVLEKSKHGFGLPFGPWMRDDPALNDLAESTLGSFAARGILREDFIAEAIRLLRTDAAGYYGELIWIVVTLELWLQARSR